MTDSQSVKSSSDADDEYVVIEDKEMTEDDILTANENINECIRAHNLTYDESSRASDAVTIADIGHGLDGATMKNANSVYESSHQALFSSSIFSAFGETQQIESIRELVLDEGEKNRCHLDEIKVILTELKEKKSHAKELSELVNFYKKSLSQSVDEAKVNSLKIGFLEETIQKLSDSVLKLNEEKTELKELNDKLNEHKVSLADELNKNNEELANKDEIIRILRDESIEQKEMHETRVKVWRERLDELERIVASYVERGETNLVQPEHSMATIMKGGSRVQQAATNLYICDNCLNAFPKKGFFVSHVLSDHKYEPDCI